ncbi:unnamed protein product [Vitrella brassicaformis CCMP3155]|uniref:Uncharacterized protein n=1 Tax=Vitrella brassicaformis (strain CCMP3155) TaxID=1169540 RepID=A0A0G4FM33_VITBC|nr:unnamed protein product [Vitrella brassicaformis CCMP3155]|eukprot:CEM15014.1 unnamed protein product [Vitrella brassicaformis CCMP3155]
MHFFASSLLALLVASAVPPFQAATVCNGQRNETSAALCSVRGLGQPSFLSKGSPFAKDDAGSSGPEEFETDKCGRFINDQWDETTFTWRKCTFAPFVASLSEQSFTYRLGEEKKLDPWWYMGHPLAPLGYYEV